MQTSKQTYTKKTEVFHTAATEQSNDVVLPDISEYSKLLFLGFNHAVPKNKDTQPTPCTGELETNTAERYNVAYKSLKGSKNASRSIKQLKRLIHYD